MKKVFEDYFTEIQTDMIDVCMENVEGRANKIYIYCSCEESITTCGYFYEIKGKVVRRHKLNDALLEGEQAYDVSGKRQSSVIRIINEDIKKIKVLCKEYNEPIPTEIKIVYDVKKNSVSADYKYDIVYSNNDIKSARDIEDEWFEEIYSKTTTN